MKRFGFVIRVEPREIERYREYHRNVWPEVLDAIGRSNIRNYSIFLKDDLLFGYYEYHGPDHASDMARIASDPKTQEWWSIMMPMQRPLDSRKPGEWWAEMDEVFHLD
jgi:L-rhamnose mutarotase